MLLPKQVLFIALSLWLADEKDLSLQVQRAVPPAHPVNTVASGIAVIEIDLERATDTLTTKVLYGDKPFAPPALDALTHWQFRVPAEANSARTSVTFLFRPPAIYSLTPFSTLLKPLKPAEDRPALPQRVIDPGYPVASVATGAVILAVRVDALGTVTGVDAILGIEPLTKQSREAVKNWKFSPAIISSKPVPSTALVVISFVLPM
jgi:hypothetical protein